VAEDHGGRYPSFKEAKVKRISAVLFALLAISAVGLALPEITAQVLEVVDGATIIVRLETVPSGSGLTPGATERVRYIGVGLPTQPGDVEAARALNAALVEGKRIFLELDEEVRDEAGRLLAYVFLDKTGKLMVNAILISTDLLSFAPLSGASRYDQILSYLDRVPAAQRTLACPVIYRWDEAQKHIGEVACVEGVVASVGTSRGGDVFLNLGRPYPDPGRFTIFIPARCVGRLEAALGARFWNNLLGRTVRALGEIRLYQGVPEIQICEPENLLIL